MVGLMIAASPFSLSGPKVDPISDGLTSYYKFNGNSNAAYGKNNGGSSNATFVSSINGQSIRYTGDNSFTQIDNFDGLLPYGGGDFTIAILVIPGQINVLQSYFGQGNFQATDSSNSFIFRILDTNEFRVLIKTTESAGSYVILDSTTQAEVSEPYLVIVKRDAGNVYLKINNTQEDSGAINFDVNQSGYKVGVGCLGEFKGGQFYGGDVNYFAVWNRALTSEEEDHLYNEGDYRKFNSISYTPLSNPLLERFIDVNTIGFSTFQSHNQKCIVNQYGTFVSYAYSAEDFPLYNFKIVRTQNEGLSYSTIIDHVSYIEPATMLETDSEGNIYSIHCNNSTEIECRKFSAPDFNQTAQVNIDGFTGHKYVMNMDESRNRIYFFMSNEFLVLDMDFNVISKETVLQNGAVYGEEYPYMSIDNSTGDVYLGWTTAEPDENAGYRSLHFMVTRDLGVTWEKADGTPLTIPVVSDETGPTNQISLIAETATDKWMSGFTFANERLHCVYWFDAATKLQRYVRVNPNTGVHEVTIDTILGTPTVGSLLLDGSFVRNSGTFASPQPLYFFTQLENKVVSTVSNDNGATWEDYEEIDNTLLGRPYAVGTYREVYGNKATSVFSLASSGAVNYTDQYSGYTYLLKLTT